MITAIVALFYVGGIVAAIHAVMTVRTAQGAVAWSVSLVTMPFVALPAYLVLGRSKFEGITAAYDQSQDKIDELVKQFRQNMDPWVIPAGDDPSMYRSVRKLAEMEMTHGNRAELLINGDSTFSSILDGVARANHYVLFQFYMFHDDKLGRQVQEALIERAKAGVRVYVLYDEIGSHGLPDTYVEKLRAAGAEVSSFKPTQGSRNRFQLNFRNHRKMVVVDGITGWVGGHNVGDEYMGRDPDFSPWRDTHVRLDGPVVQQLQAVILSDWYWATRELPELNWQPQAAEGADVKAMIVPFAPSSRFETAGLFFVTALNSAKKRIWLSAPYFVPDEAILKALQLAALRGVDVRIITTGKPDSWPVYLAAFKYIDYLRDLGIKFYSYQPGFLHEKVSLVDDEFATVGTPNFDNRSFRLNFEVTSLIVDKAFASEMEKMFEEDFAHAVIIDPAELDKKPFWWHLAVNLSRLAAPIL
ncbi:MAG: cardiolipin synthase [Betaproteobacteria bacterium]|jgi:cardiolipin synthase|nr:MAG: cardiolipin synthase [Betaproteobacteria bacterium]